MKRLAVVHHVVSAGGVERLVDALLSEMAKVAGVGWEITLLTVERNSAGAEVSAARALPNHITLQWLGKRTRRPMIDTMLRGQRILGIPGTGRALRALARPLDYIRSRWFEGGMSHLRKEIEEKLASGSFDVVYFPYPYLIKPPRTDAAAVGTFHDFNHRHTASLPDAMRKRLDRQMPNWLDRCDRIVTSVEVIRNELTQLYPGRDHKTRLVRPSFPYAQPNPTESELSAFRTSKGLPPRFVLTTGWIVPHKNQAVVLEAIAHLKSKGRDVALTCTGPNSHELQPEAATRSPYITEIVEHATHAGLEYGSDYLALGYVTDMELECLYRLAMAVVVPAVYEAGSFSGIEAMRAGCPVVFSRTAANEEQADLVDGNAWLFEPQQATDLSLVLEEISSDPEETRAKAERASRIVRETLSWERTAREYLQVFEEACDEYQAR